MQQRGAYLQGSSNPGVCNREGTEPPCGSGSRRSSDPINGLLVVRPRDQQVDAVWSCRCVRIRQGNQLSWDLEDASVRVRAVTPLDVTYLRGLEAGLQEWSSADDDAAFAEL